MSKKIPLCAFCGKALVAPRVMFDFSWCPGGPRIGWHEGCTKKDEDWVDCAWDSSTGGESQDPPPEGTHAPVVVEVFKRGADRVTCATGKGSKKRFDEAMDEALMGAHR